MSAIEGSLRRSVSLIKMRKCLLTRGANLPVTRLSCEGRAQELDGLSCSRPLRDVVEVGVCGGTERAGHRLR